jgi:hypothetical protein
MAIAMSNPIVYVIEGHNELDIGRRGRQNRHQGTAPTNLQDIPGGNKVVNDEDDDGVEAENGSDDQDDSDEGYEDGEVDDASKYAEL